MCVCVCVCVCWKRGKGERVLVWDENEVSESVILDVAHVDASNVSQETAES